MEPYLFRNMYTARNLVVMHMTQCSIAFETKSVLVELNLSLMSRKSRISNVLK